MAVRCAWKQPYRDLNQVTIAIRWEALEVNGVKQPLSIASGRQAGNERTSAPGRLRQRPVAFESPRPGELRYAVFHFSGEHIVVGSGLKSQWFTVAP